MESINPSDTVAWEKLRLHFEKMEFVQMQNLFAEDKNRIEKMSVEWGSVFLDYSKNKITTETIELLGELAQEVGLQSAIEAMFCGEKINKTENRAVLHTALRDFSDADHIVVEGVNVLREIRETRAKIKSFTNKVLSGEYLSSTGKKFQNVINIGIGGSDLGPKMVVNALENYRNSLHVHFISNVDNDYLFSVLKKLDPETTLMLVVSKTFTTQETIINALTVREWLKKSLQTGDISTHLIGVSANIDEAVKFGLRPENVFPMWDYVGGRYSLWSAVGLSVALTVGYDNFEKLLKGANALDEHFKNTEFKKNIPVLCALLSVWYNNFFDYETEAVVPYSQLLEKFPAHLQQMIMESNGKNISRGGTPVNYQTGTLVWGEVGVSAQHAFFQLFHQGTKVVPIDFIGFINPFFEKSKQSHDILMSNFFGQSEALLNGKRGETYCSDNQDILKEFKDFEGNKPSNTILIDQLTPETLGMLIALYEHKTFVQGVIWNIFSFDQFGVEYGKILAKNIQNEIFSKKINKHDCSTRFLLNYYLKSNKN